jgi:hypothetical protein
VLDASSKNKIDGLITDGDLRRALRTHAPEKWAMLTAADIMTRDPLTIEHSVLAIDAMKRMERNNKKAVSVLPVVGVDGKVVGVLRLHDLVQAGLVEQAKQEARRALDALTPFVKRGVSIVGLEPSCLLTMRDEFLQYGWGEEAQALSDSALLFEEFLVREHKANRLNLPLSAIQADTVLLHGHCHQKAFDALPAEYKAVLKIAAAEANQWSTAKYDTTNPAALRRLISNGAQLKRFSPEILQACYKANQQFMTEMIDTSPAFKRIHGPWSKFRDEYVLWSQFSEMPFDNLMATGRKG